MLTFICADCESYETYSTPEQRWSQRSISRRFTIQTLCEDCEDKRGKIAEIKRSRRKRSAKKDKQG